MISLEEGYLERGDEDGGERDRDKPSRKVSRLDFFLICAILGVGANCGSVFLFLSFSYAQRTKKRVVRDDDEEGETTAPRKKQM